MNYLIELIRRSKTFFLYVLLAMMFALGVFAESNGLIEEFKDAYEDWIYLLRQNVYIVFASGTTRRSWGSRPAS